jgi:hypothetical protein
MSSSISSSSSLEASITLKIVEEKNDDDDDECYGAFTSITATVFQSGGITTRRIGEISGIKANRQKIPTGCFWETFDGHSAEMEWIAGTLLLENKYGRPTLQSIHDAGDTPEENFLLIQSFRIDENQRGCNSDVATIALRKFIYSNLIYSEYIKGDFVCLVSSIAYELSVNNINNNSPNNNNNNNNTGYHESVPFLRNGFLQDQALVRKFPESSRILVGAFNNFAGNNVESEAQVMAAAAKLIATISSSSSDSDPSSEKDIKILIWNKSCIHQADRP